MTINGEKEKIGMDTCFAVINLDVDPSNSIFLFKKDPKALAYDVCEYALFDILNKHLEDGWVEKIGEKNGLEELARLAVRTGKKEEICHLSKMLEEAEKVTSPQELKRLEKEFTTMCGDERGEFSVGFYTNFLEFFDFMANFYEDMTLNELQWDILHNQLDTDYTSLYVYASIEDKGDVSGDSRRFIKSFDYREMASAVFCEYLIATFVSFGYSEWLGTVQNCSLDTLIEEYHNTGELPEIEELLPFYDEIEKIFTEEDLREFICDIDSVAMESYIEATYYGEFKNLVDMVEDMSEEELRKEVG